MEAVEDRVPEANAPERGDDATTGLIRGSSLLLIGRALSLAVGMVIQVIIVRYLTKSTFGAFAYALSLVQLGETISTFGLDRAVTRFIPIYEERGEHAKMFGTFVLVVGTILGLGLALIVAGIGLRAAFGAELLGDREAMSLLGILIVLVPVRALDNVLMGTFAVFSRPGSIFFRKYLLEPGLQLAVVLLLVTRRSPVGFLAAGYVAAGAVGLVVYVGMAVRLLSERGLFRRFREAGVNVPLREILGFTLPLLSSDLLYAVMSSTDAVILGRYRGASEVAAFRVVQPVARMNQFVMLSFALLFTPVAARLFARDDRAGLRRAYGHTTTWMTMLSFPIFALTFSLAGPVTTTLYGERYASSAVILALLSAGYFVSTASGFNGLTLKVLGRLRAVVAINLMAVVLNLTLNLILIPRHGALGAAVGTTATLLAHNLLKQIAVRRAAGVRLLDPGRRMLYVAMAAAAGVLLAVQAVASPPLAVGIVMAGGASLAVLAAGRRLLELDDTFPELMRIRGVRALAGGGKR